MSKLSSWGARWQELKRRIFDRDGSACSSCGSRLESEHPDASHGATVDHIVPKAAGGGDEENNLTAMCRRCNGIKQDKAVVRVGWYNPRWLPERAAA